MTADALLDSNVILASLGEWHEHHKPSLNLFADQKRRRFAVSAHSYAECYSHLTRRGDHALFQMKPEEAWAALSGVAAITELIGLTPAQTLAAVRTYSEEGGIGARIYDKLIGEAAMLHGLSTIITWNVRHMRSLFQSLETVTPSEFLLG